MARQTSQIQAPFHSYRCVVAEHGGGLVEHSYREAEKAKLLPARQGACQGHKGVHHGVSKEPSSVRVDSKGRHHSEEGREAKTATNNRRISLDLLGTPH